MLLLQPFEIEPRMRISSVPEGGLDSEEITGEEGAPSTTRRITSYIDTSTTANPLLVSYWTFLRTNQQSCHFIVSYYRLTYAIFLNCE